MEQEAIARLETLERRLARLEAKRAVNDYQGWDTYETWVISLWMDNEAKQAVKMQMQAQSFLGQNKGDKREAAYDFAQWLQAEFEENLPHAYKADVYGDLLSGALSQVDWREIADYWMSDAEWKPPIIPTRTATRKKQGEAGPPVVEASPEVLDILRRSTVDDDGLTLPPEQLERSLYEAVNTLLLLAGCKWNTGKKRHLFKTKAAREKIKALLESGQVVDEKKHFQAFYTPATVAAELVGLADIQAGMTCLEPSAGEGAIALAAKQAGANVTTVEMNPEAVSVLESHGFTPEVRDFLTLEPQAAYDRVLMNPPFTNHQDIRHVQHAYRFLKPGGKLYSIMSPSFTFGDAKERQEFRQFLAEHGRVVKELPAGAFSESGTEVRTVIVELAKPADDTPADLFSFTAS